MKNKEIKMSSKENKKDVPQGWPAWAGNHPFPPDKKRPVLITSDKEVTTIYGTGRDRISPRIFISTDKILLSEWIVPPGGTFSPPDIHSGDEPYYVRKGVATIVNPETGQTLEVPEGDAVLIPAKSWHQVYNFTEQDVDIIAIIEGNMWDEADTEAVTDFTLKAKFYKGE